MNLPLHTLLYQVNTRVRLGELARASGRRVTLGEIPDEELDRWGELGFAWVWLLGVWKTGPAGRGVSLGEGAWRRGYVETLGGDLRDEDVTGSPFAIQEYVVDPALGDDEGLALLRARLNARGMKLMLDFVPNQTALDHAWAFAHPEYYVQGSDDDLRRDPHGWTRVETAVGPRVLAHGSEPYGAGWTDTLQLNFRHTGLRRAMVAEAERIAARCDGVRCDMAMLLLPDVFRANWGAASEPADGSAPDDASWWAEAIPAVLEARSEFVWMAEVYWDREWELLQQGFHFTYDKRLYDRLRTHDVQGVRAHLGADAAFQARQVRFLENHDEGRAATTFAPEVHRPAAVITFLSPGMGLVHDGQLQGRRVKTSIHLGRRPDEPPDAGVEAFYAALLAVLRRPEVRSGTWCPVECRPAWEGHEGWRGFVAFGWATATETLLVCVNYTGVPGQCRVVPPRVELRGSDWELRDLVGPARYVRSGDELAETGLFLDLPPWGFHVFELRGERGEEDVDVPGLTLRHRLAGHGDVVNRIAWAPDGERLASTSDDQTVRVWDSAAGRELQCLHLPHRTLSVAWSADGSRLAAAVGDGSIHQWSTADWGPLPPLSAHADWVNSVQAHPSDPLRLASASADRTLCIWDAGDPERERLRWSAHSNNIFSVRFSPDGKTLASASADTLVRLWDGHGRLLRTFNGHADQVLSLSWSPDGHTLASASIDNTARVWAVSADRHPAVLEAHTHDVRAVSFSADGRLLATKSADGTVKIWRTDDWVVVADLHESAGHGWLSGLAFHPRLPLLATLGDRDCAVRVWELDLPRLLGAAATPTERHISAKIVLVGESNVGKSCLATRLVEDRYPGDEELGSTLGMRFLRVDPARLDRRVPAPAGERRELVLWDLGGQEEYRLVHQIFLHDTAIALVLLDPRRGQVALDEVRAWNLELEKQLSGQKAVKILVGAKLDQAGGAYDRAAVHELCGDCGFADYVETSARTGRGVDGLRRAIVRHLDWNSLAGVSRVSLLQHIHDEIERRAKRGEISISLKALTEVVRASSAEEIDEDAVKGVAEQLSKRGEIVYTRRASDEHTLVLSIEAVERYAGALVSAARANPRRVPALDECDLAPPAAALSALPWRLEPEAERVVLESVVALLVEDGICFRHAGMLIFPSLFPSGGDGPPERLRYSSALSYDFTGAIDKIYASLVAFLALSGQFGQHRLWRNQVEFDQAGQGICGLRRITRKYGLAHLDLYFSDEVAEERRDLFIRFVQDHLRRFGVDVREHLTVLCGGCGAEISEAIVRRNLQEGYRDVICPWCRARTLISEGVESSAQRDLEASQKLFALGPHIEREARQDAQKVMVVVSMGRVPAPDHPIRILHLSDLHFTAATDPRTTLEWLGEDLARGAPPLPACHHLDYLVVSGDMADRASPGGLEKAREFVSQLIERFGLSAQRCILVPGNHDVLDIRESYDWFMSEDDARRVEPDQARWHRQGQIVFAPRRDTYPRRLEQFSDGFFHKLVQQPYPLDETRQGVPYLFPDTRIQFLAFNSCWQIDQFHRRRSGIDPRAVAHCLAEATQQYDAAVRAGQLEPDAALLRIAVWHHAVAGPDAMQDLEFLGHLQHRGVKLCLHGDVHELRRELIGYWHERRVHVVGAGSFAAPGVQRPESVPRLYNLLEVAPTLDTLRVHTRCQATPNGAWKGCYVWEREDGAALPYYDVPLVAGALDVSALAPAPVSPGDAAPVSA